MDFERFIDGEKVLFIFNILDLFVYKQIVISIIDMYICEDRINVRDYMRGRAAANSRYR